MNAEVTRLEAEGDEKRIEDAREEISVRLAEVHSRLSDIDAESGPARAAALLYGEADSSTDPTILTSIGLGFDEVDQQRPTKTFSGGWRCIVQVLLSCSIY